MKIDVVQRKISAFAKCAQANGVDVTLHARAAKANNNFVEKLIVGLALMAVSWGGVMVASASGNATGVTTLRIVNDTGRTAIVRNIKADGAKVVTNGCHRWVPNNSSCQIAILKVASSGALVVDFDGVTKSISFGEDDESESSAELSRYQRPRN